MILVAFAVMLLCLKGVGWLRMLLRTGRRPFQGLINKIFLAVRVGRSQYLDELDELARANHSTKRKTEF